MARGGGLLVHADLTSSHARKGQDSHEGTFINRRRFFLCVMMMTIIQQQDLTMIFQNAEPVMGRGRSRPLRNLLTRMDEVTVGPLSVLRRCMVDKIRVKV